MSPLTRYRRCRPSEAVADDVPIPAGPVDAEEAGALRAAIELRTANPGADLPSAEFVEGLRRRLGDLEGEGAPRRLGRRAFLTKAGAGAGAVAAGVAGAVVDRTLLQPTAPGSAASATLEPADGVWVRVAEVGEVTGRTVRFSTSSVVAFVTERAGNLVAVSGACSHQGCLLQLNEVAERLDCPCHRTSFSSEGRLLFHQVDTSPPPLARLRVRRNGDVIEVLVPTGTMPEQA